MNINISNLKLIRFILHWLHLNAIQSKIKKLFYDNLQHKKKSISLFNFQRILSTEFLQEQHFVTDLFQIKRNAFRL